MLAYYPDYTLTAIGESESVFTDVSVEETFMVSQSQNIAIKHMLDMYQGTDMEQVEEENHFVFLDNIKEPVNNPNLAETLLFERFKESVKRINKVTSNPSLQVNQTCFGAHKLAFVYTPVYDYMTDPPFGLFGVSPPTTPLAAVKFCVSWFAEAGALINKGLEKVKEAKAAVGRAVSNVESVGKDITDSAEKIAKSLKEKTEHEEEVAKDTTSTMMKSLDVHEMPKITSSSDSAQVKGAISKLSDAVKNFPTLSNEHVKPMHDNIDAIQGHIDGINENFGSESRHDNWMTGGVMVLPGIGSQPRQVMGGEAYTIKYDSITFRTFG